MHEINATLKIKCASEQQWLEISSFLKTVLHTLDFAVESKHEGNDFHSTTENLHPESVTSIKQSEHPLRKPFGL